MNGLSINKVAIAVLAGLLFMAGVRAAIELTYPAGTENLSKGKIAVAPGQMVAKR